MTTEANIPPELFDRIRKMIREEIAAEARTAPLRSARITGKNNGLTISDGARLRVRHPEADGGDDAFYVGDIYDAVTGEYLGTGVLLEQPDGTDIAQFRTDAATGMIRAFVNDGGGRTAFSVDGVGGQGLGRPFIPARFFRHRFADLSVSTTSAAFETLWSAMIYKQHAKLTVGVRASMDTAGTAGEIRVLVNGVQLGAVTSRAFAVADTSWLGPVAGSHMASLAVEIQGRRTSASGALRVEPMWCWGLPSDAV